MSETEKPTLVKKRAIDVTPNDHGIWCSIMDGKPFVNPICSRAWSKDGSKILFGLDSHNSYSAAPDDEIDVVEIQDEYRDAEWRIPYIKKDAARMANRPDPARTALAKQLREAADALEGKKDDSPW